MAAPTLARRFLDRFRGLEHAHGTYVTGAVDAHGKVTGQARTLKERVGVKQWKDHLTGKIGLGVTPIDKDSRCRFGAIDVDVYDLTLEALEARVKDAGLPLVVCRTKSGGAHLYLFMAETAPAGLVREKLMEWAVIIGHPKVEVFPKQSEIVSEDDVGSWLNMPYFGGDRTTRYAVVRGARVGPEEFLEHADAVSVTEKQLRKLEGKQDPALDGAPPCLQHLAHGGFPVGTRNMALFNLGVFCKFKYGDEWMDRAREMNKKYLTPPLSDAEATTTLKQVGKKTYFYRCKEAPIAAACNRSICGRREYGISRSGDDPGVTLDGLVKVMTDPPMWFVNVNGHRVQLDSSEDLLNQRRFERVCVDAHNLVPNRIRENAWRELLRDLMEKVEELSAPEDAGPLGQFMYLLERFCTERAGAEGPSEILLERVLTRDGRMYFHSAHLLAFLDRYRFRTTAKAAWAMLREAGGEPHRFRVQDRIVRTWSVPAFETSRASTDGPRAVDDGGEDIF